MATGLMAGVMAGLALVPMVDAAQDGSQKPDQISRRNARGRVLQVSGIVTANTLESVSLDRAGKEEKYDSEDVVAITWGTVPASFQDGKTYEGRKDYANAVAKFRLTAADTNVREVVRAAARYASARNLLAMGATDPTQFTECIAECDNFLTNFAANRAQPLVERLKARATLLSGDAASAATQFKALYLKSAELPGTTGYDREYCVRAGMDAAFAFLETGQTGPARELLVGLDRPLSDMINGIEDTTDLKRVRLETLRAESQVGEGFCDLVGGQSSQAINFFSTRSKDTNLPAGARFSATLGLAQAYMGDGKLREAQIHFAKVAAIDHGSRDRAAAALLGLAKCSTQLRDSDAATVTKKYLEQIVATYGDTPAAREANELLKK